MDANGHPGFGNYNVFVILLSLLKFIGFNTAFEFITFKAIFYPITAFYLYKLSKIYINEKLSLISVILFSALPGYILLNTILMRDTFVLLFLIMAFYYILNDNLNIKTKIFFLVPILFVLLSIRAYAAPILLSTIVFCYKNSKRIFSFRDALFLLIIAITIIFFTTYKFTNGELMILGNFSDEQMRILQENFTAMYGSGIIAPIKVLISTLIHIFYVPPFLNFMASGLVYLIIFSLGNILSVITSILFIPSFISLAIKKGNSNIIYLLKFTFYFTFIHGILLMSKDGFIITRLSLMWTPLFIIIILVALDKFLVRD